MVWEVKKTKRLRTDRDTYYWARNKDSNSSAARCWHWVKLAYLKKAGIDFPRHSKSGWEVDWSHPENTGNCVWARNPLSNLPSARKWHWTTTGFLRSVGVNTPIFRKDSWEVDWSNRNGKLVWARNQYSKMPCSREWHWVDFHTLSRSGVAWRPKKEKSGKYIDASGYVVLTRRFMTEQDISLCEQFDLFRGDRKTFVKEHQLVAVKKYKKSIKGFVVRHLNGIKDDNREENLVLGTTQQNTMDHNTARLEAMYWKEKYEMLLDAENK